MGGWTDNTQPGTYLVNPVIDEIDGSYANRSGDILFSNTGNSKGLGVTAPTSIEAFASGGVDSEMAPPGGIYYYQFPARGSMPPVKFTGLGSDSSTRSLRISPRRTPSMFRP